VRRRTPAFHIELRAYADAPNNLAACPSVEAYPKLRKGRLPYCKGCTASRTVPNGSGEGGAGSLMGKLFQTVAAALAGLEPSRVT